MTQKGINWGKLPIYLKRGSCCIRETYLSCNKVNEEKDASAVQTHLRTRWVIDKEIPVFKGENRNYIERLINFED